VNALPVGDSESVAVSVFSEFLALSLAVSSQPKPLVLHTPPRIYREIVTSDSPIPFLDGPRVEDALVRFTELISTSRSVETDVVPADDTAVAQVETMLLMVLSWATEHQGRAGVSYDQDLWHEEQSVDAGPMPNGSLWERMRRRFSQGARARADRK
jgi:hypothetical protein